MRSVSLLLMLLLVQSCLGPGIFHEKPKPVENKVFTASLTINPHTSSFNPLPASTQIIFPADIDMSTVSAADFVLTGTGTCSMALLSSYAEVEHVVTLTLNTGSCSHSNKIIISIDMANVLNVKGQTGVGVFTETYLLDLGHAVSPVLNLLSGVYNTLPSSFSFLLDDSIDLSTVTADMLEITGTGSCVDATLFTALTLSGHEATVQLDTSSCSNGDVVDVILHTDGLRDDQGRSGVGDFIRHLTYDNQGPIASDILVSMNSGYYNPINSTLNVVFPDDVNMAGIDSTTFSLIGNGSCTLNASGSFTKTGHTVILGINSASCQNLNHIQFSMNMGHVKDYANNPTSGTIAREFILLTSLPAAPSINQPSGFFSSLPLSVIATFSDDIDMSTVNTTSVTMAGTGGCPLNSLLSLSNNLHASSFLVNMAGCQDGGTITLSIDMSLVKNVLGAAGSGIIHRVYVLDSSGPGFPSINFESGTYGSMPSPLILAFGSDTDMSTVSASLHVTSTGSCAASPWVSTVMNQTEATVTLNTSGCVDGDTITLSVDMISVKDVLNNPGTGTFTVVYTLDSNVPSGPSVDVLPGTYNPMPAELNFAFGPDINMGTLTIADFIVQGTPGCPDSYTLVKNLQTAKLTFSNTTCANQSLIAVSLDMSGLENNLGTSGTGVLHYNYTLDNVGPSTVLISPVSGILNVLPSEISFTFPADTKLSSLALADLVITPVQGCASAALHTLTFLPNMAKVQVDNSSCANGDSYKVSLQLPLIEDLTGNAGTGSVEVEYTLDNAGPTAGLLNPDTGTFQNFPGTLSVLLPSDANMASLTEADLTFVGSNSCTATVGTSMVKSGFAATVSLSTSGCVSGDTLTVKLAMTGVTDLYGNPGVGVVQKVYTLDREGVAAGAVTVAPVAGTYAALPTTITVTMPSDVNMNSVELSDFSVVGAGACPANGLSGLSASGQIVTLTLTTAGCANNNTEILNINMAGIVDSVGNPGTGYIQNIYKLDSVGPDAPTVSKLSGSYRTLPASLVYTFPSDTDISTISISDFSWAVTGTCNTAPVSLDPVVSHTVTVNIDSSGCLNTNSISVTLSMAAIQDGLGNNGTAMLSRIFTVDTQGPASATFDKVTGDYRSLPTVVNVTFTSDTDMSSVLAADFTVSGSGTCPANPLTSVTMDGQMAKLNLNTSGCIDTSTISVTLNMTGVEDALGNSGVSTVNAVYTMDVTGPALPSVDKVTSTYAALPSLLTYTFPPETDMDTVVSGKFAITSTGSCSSTQPATLSKSGQVATLSVNTSGCAHGHQISVALNMWGIMDAIGNTSSATLTHVYTLDVMGPAAPLVNRASSAYAALPSTVDYTFTSDTDMASVDIGDFSASGTGGCHLNSPIAITKNPPVARITLDVIGCAHNGTMSLSLDMTGIKDDLGNVGLSTLNRVFTLDILGPIDPLINRTTDDYTIIPASATITFSADTDMNSVVLADFTGSSTGTCPVNPLASISKLGQVATLNFDTTGCSHNSSITFSLNMGLVKDALGNAGTGLITRTLTQDSSGPLIPMVDKVSADVSVLPTTLVYTFSADTYMDSVTTADFTVTGTGSCAASPVISLGKAAQVGTLTISTLGCSNGSTLGVVLNMSGITDRVGNSGGVGTLVRTFTLDTAGPVIATVDKVTNTYGVLPTTLYYTFSSDTLMSSVTDVDFTVTGTGGCPATQTASVSKNLQVATVTLSRVGCGHNGSISISLNMAGVTDALGNAGVSTLNRTFTLDSLGPVAATVDKVSGAYSTLPTTVKFTFPADVNLASITAASFSAVGLVGCPANPIQSVSTGTLVVTVTLNTTGCLDTGSIALSLNMANVTDAYGNSGSGTVDRTFIKDITPPPLPSLDIVGASLVTLPTSLTYTFAADVDMSTVTTANFSVSGTGNCLANPLNGIVITPGSRTAVVNLNTSGCTLLPASKINVNFNMSGVKDNAGNAGTGTLNNAYIKIL